MKLFKISDGYLKYLILIFVFIQIIDNSSVAQDNPYEISYYNFIRYDDNHFKFFNDSLDFMSLFKSFNDLILKGDGTINVVHIGDSHIQADYYSGRIRQRLQTFFQGGLGGRGFIFPYTVANTNNPSNYKIKYTGNWIPCRNVENDKNCDLGLSGISVTSYDSIASIAIILNDNDYPKYDFNKVKIFHPVKNNEFSVIIDKYLEKKSVLLNDSLGYTMFLLENYIDTLFLKFIKTDSLQNEFVLHGISLETDDPGVVYHSIGVNGAKAESYLRCNLFSQHLKALEPDWIIISLGTNDAYHENFDEKVFEEHYETLIKKIKSAAQGKPLLLTVPGDSYRFRKYLNKDMIKVKEVIYKLAEKYNCGIWDFYSVMGGLNSIVLWDRNGLAGKDKLHFSKEGYLLQGDLFFNAFLKKYDEYIDQMLDD
ncbi:MAG: hypothetical protein KAT68_05100 [Bacteroidales bacterium]|nr:hypothetical protein [Bacteroidales bacterium]